MDWLHIVAAIGGPCLSCGIAYGVLRTSLKHTHELLDLFRAELVATRAKMDELTTRLADCDKRIALVAVELNLGLHKRAEKN